MPPVPPVTEAIDSCRCRSMSVSLPNNWAALSVPRCPPSPQRVRAATGASLTGAQACGRAGAQRPSEAV